MLVLFRACLGHCGSHNGLFLFGVKYTLTSTFPNFSTVQYYQFSIRCAGQRGAAREDQQLGCSAPNHSYSTVRRIYLKIGDAGKRSLASVDDVVPK